MKKNFKLVLALVLALSLFASMTAAFADPKITITRDSSWDNTAESKSTTYTIYKVLDATIGTSATVSATDGTSSGGAVAYFISGTDSNATAKKTALASLFTFTEAADGNFYATKNYSGSDADFLAALKTAVTTSGSGFTAETPVTTDSTPVVLQPTEGIGYYLILASNGKDIVVQTLDDVQINEKNDYPKIDKKQKQDDDTEYHENVEPAEIGSYIDYQVTVTIPGDVNQSIYVYDAMSAGLEYDTEAALTLKNGSDNLAATDWAYIASSDTTHYDNVRGKDWQIELKKDYVTAHAGETVVITYRAKVTSAALTDTNRENDVTLKYDNNNYILTDYVKYTTYFAGIYKIDGNDSTADMSGIKFELKDKNGDAVNVTYDSTNKYYVVDASSTSNEVETRADGTNYTIKIRGLDSDMGTYTLTETDTKDGYNLLATPANLTLTEDKDDAFSSKAANTFDQVVNNKGATLPSTGGIGTTIFYIAGSVLVLAAAILLITKRRMGSND